MFLYFNIDQQRLYCNQSIDFLYLNLITFITIYNINYFILLSIKFYVYFEICILKF